MSTIDGRVPDQIEGEEDIEPRAEGFSGTVVTGVKWKMLTVLVSEGTRVIVSLVLARLLVPSEYGVADGARRDLLPRSRSRIRTRDRARPAASPHGRGPFDDLLGDDCDRRDRDGRRDPDVRAGRGHLRRPGRQAAVRGGIREPLPQLCRGDPTGLDVARAAFRSLQIREIGATACGATVALVVAFSGYGAWAIVANWVTFSATSTVLVWLLAEVAADIRVLDEEPPGPRWLRAEGLRARILVGERELDNVLVGRYLGAGSLGAYSLAYNVMFMPMARVGPPLQQVVSPVFARLQTERERLERAWLRSKQVSCALLISGCLVTPRRRARSGQRRFRVEVGRRGGAASVALRGGGRAVARGAPLRHPAGVRRGQCPAPAQHRRRRRDDRRVHRGHPFGIVGVAAFYAAARWLLVPVDTWITVRAVSFDYWAAFRQGRHRCRSGSSRRSRGYAARLELVDAGATRHWRGSSSCRVSFSSSTSTDVGLLPPVVEEIVRLIRDRAPALARTRPCVDPNPSSSAT